MKAGIAIDPWKSPIFERRLKEAGYTFEAQGDIGDGLFLLTVETTNLEALAMVVQDANDEAAKTRMH